MNASTSARARRGARRPREASRRGRRGRGRTGRAPRWRRAGRRPSATASSPTARTPSGSPTSGSPRSGCGSAARPRRAGVAPMASTRPRWASEVTSATPDRPRATRSRKNASQPAPSSARGDLQAEDLAVPVGVDPDRDQGVHVHHPATFADLEHERVGGEERCTARRRAGGCGTPRPARRGRRPSPRPATSTAA